MEPDLSIKGYPNIFVLGDLAHYAHQDGKPPPGIAPVAMKQGRYVGCLIKQRLAGKTENSKNLLNSANFWGPRLPRFHYVYRGSLTVIGQNSAVVDLGSIKFTGFLAWLFWLLIQIYFLIEFDNKLVVMIQWSWNYFTRKRGARLIVPQELTGYYAADQNRQILNY